MDSTGQTIGSQPGDFGATGRQFPTSLPSSATYSGTLVANAHYYLKITSSAYTTYAIATGVTVILGGHQLYRTLDVPRGTLLLYLVYFEKESSITFSV